MNTNEFQHLGIVQHFITVWKLRNFTLSLSRIFGENLVKVTVKLKKSLNSWFDEIFFCESKFSICTVIALSITLIDYDLPSFDKCDSTKF